MVLALWVRERSCAWTPGDLESGDDAMIATALIPLDLKNRNLEQTCNQSELFWYAVYTSANHEKRVASQLEQRAIESFLPLYDAVHRWRDRKMRLQLPLFPSYVFVRMFLRERVRVLQVPGVARLVGFGERPLALPEQEIEILRSGLGRGMNAQPHPYLTVGRHVRVMHGPLSGLEGVLLRRKGAFRLILSIDLIMKSIVVDVDVADVRPLETGARRKSQEVACANVARFTR